MAVGVQLSLSAPNQALGGDPTRAAAKTRKTKSKRGLATARRLAGMVELVDTLCSGRSDRMVVRVQLSLPAPHSIAAEPVSTGREREPKGSLFFFSPPLPSPPATTHTRAHFYLILPSSLLRRRARIGAWGSVQAWIFFFWGGGKRVKYWDVWDVLQLRCLDLSPDWVPNPARRTPRIAGSAGLRVGAGRAVMNGFSFDGN